MAGVPSEPVELATRENWGSTLGFISSSSPVPDLGDSRFFPFGTASSASSSTSSSSSSSPSDEASARLTSGEPERSTLMFGMSAGRTFEMSISGWVCGWRSISDFGEVEWEDAGAYLHVALQVVDDRERPCAARTDVGCSSLFRQFVQNEMVKL